MVAKKPWNNCCSDVIKLPILSNTYNIEFTKNGRRADIFCIFYTTGYKTSLITVQKAHRDGFYINICNNILSVHENFPMIASMPSWLLFLFWIVVWKCALYFTWLKIRPPYFFFSLTTRMGLFECVPTQVFKKASTLFQMQVPATLPVVPGGKLLKGLQIESLKRDTVFSGNQTNWLLRKALALWLNPGS